MMSKFAYGIRVVIAALDETDDNAERRAADGAPSRNFTITRPGTYGTPDAPGRSALTARSPAGRRSRPTRRGPGVSPANTPRSTPPDDVGCATARPESGA